MNIKVVVVGPLRTNCYIVEKGNSCIVIDPGAEPELIIKNIDKSKKVIGIFITHGHDDHIGALVDLTSLYKCPIYNGNNLTEGTRSFENFSMKIISFPGHLDDSVAFYFEENKVMFVGDFIFKGSIGRYDLKGASPFDMRHSIEKVLTMDPDIVLLPGHGEQTILRDEIENLKYFKSII